MRKAGERQQDGVRVRRGEDSEMEYEYDGQRVNLEGRHFLPTNNINHNDINNNNITIIFLN